ncbi:hypothetical protein [Blackfly microvirus SF02]|uniref:Uncharacterized protein n=1 Tax=Blackfly microvirus SF02 TaxID=2576452 RepID=A0A4P8PJR1_9VIRU|nr:hypothetical protein [Blackfly microvirus SF02]
MMKLKLPVHLSRVEFDKLSKAFSDPSIQNASFEFLSDIKAIHFDSCYHSLVCGSELEAVTARVELK